MSVAYIEIEEATAEELVREATEYECLVAATSRVIELLEERAPGMDFESASGIRYLAAGIVEALCY